MKIVFVHGWGFSPDLWEPIQKNLQDYDCSVVNLGYWGNTPTAINLLPEEALYVGHSLGLMWILKNTPQKLSGLISINGFDCFYRHTPQANLDKMKYELAINPERLLTAFYRQCGQKKLELPSILDINLLREGLNLLSHLDLKEKRESLRIPIAVLASQNDRIVPQSMTETIWHDHNIIWSKTGGHALPLTQSQWCSSHILNFIKKLQKTK